MKNQNLVTGLLLGALLTIVFETGCRLISKAETFYQELCVEESTGSIILSRFEIEHDWVSTDEKDELIPM